MTDAISKEAVIKALEKLHDARGVTESYRNGLWDAILLVRSLPLVVADPPQTISTNAETEWHHVKTTTNEAPHHYHEVTRLQGCWDIDCEKNHAPVPTDCDNFVNVTCAKCGEPVETPPPTELWTKEFEDVWEWYERTTKPAPMWAEQAREWAHSLGGEDGGDLAELIGVHFFGELPRALPVLETPPPPLDEIIDDLLLEKADPKFAPEYEEGEQEQYGLGGYAAGLQYAIDALEGHGPWGAPVEPVPAPTMTKNALADAMNEAFAEFCADTGCAPDCFQIHGPRTTSLSADFHIGNFVKFVVDILSRDSAPVPAPPKISTNGEWTDDEIRRLSTDLKEEEK